MRKISIFLGVLLLVIFSFSLLAGASIAPPPILNTDDLKVGTWAKIRQVEKDTSMDIWMGIVGEERINSKRYVWLEARFNINGQKMITKVLLRFDRSNNESDIKKIIFKMGNQPAMEISPDMMGMMGQNMNFFGSSGEDEENAKIKVVGKEKVKVPAGTFIAKHIKVISKKDSSTLMDIWESDKVPIKIVKITTSQGSKMELLAYGNGAKSEITEKPVPFSMPNMVNPNK